MEFRLVLVRSRLIISTIGEAMRIDLKLSDTQLGLLGGLAFALFYAAMGIPMARLAERGARVKLIGFTALLWSGATAACGMTSHFWHLLLARMGVGIGEAGFLPDRKSTRLNSSH